MDKVISTLLSGVRLGTGRTAGGLTLVPVFADLPAGPDYVTLAEALGDGTLVVTEIDAGGSVPTLRARNTGERYVLILDGEELAGAKQNRVLNTTILIAAGKEVAIPVSCTEHGRWHYTSKEFLDSGYAASHRVRHVQHESVTANVRAAGVFESDQGRVWDEVGMLADRSGVHSPTGAMRDVYQERSGEVAELVRAFGPEPGQRGILAVAGGQVVGLDLISREEAYARLHGKLVASYGIETLSESAQPGEDDGYAAKAFVAELAGVTGTEHGSPGSGRSHRFTGGAVVGSALTYRDAILHAAFFAVEPGSTGVRGGGMARYGTRIGWLSGGEEPRILY